MHSVTAVDLASCFHLSEAALGRTINPLAAASTARKSTMRELNDAERACVQAEKSAVQVINEAGFGERETGLMVTCSQLELSAVVCSRQRISIPTRGC